MLTFDLPWPNPKLNPNRSKGAHWSAGAALRKKARNDSGVITRRAMLAAIAYYPELATKNTLKLSIVFVQPDRRARDRDNLLAALKPSIDGIADALLINDSQFDPVTISREYGTKPGYVRVTIG